MKIGTYSDKSLKNGSMLTIVASSGLIEKELKEEEQKDLDSYIFRLFSCLVKNSGATG